MPLPSLEFEWLENDFGYQNSLTVVFRPVRSRVGVDGLMLYKYPYYNFSNYILSHENDFDKASFGTAHGPRMNDKTD